MSLASRDINDRLFAELRSRNDDQRQRAALDIRHYLENVQRELLSSTEFAELYAKTVARMSALVVSGVESQEKIGGIHGLSQLVDFKGDPEPTAKMTRFANCLRSVLRGTDTAAMVVAARALGKLAQPGSPLTAELVDAEISALLESLQVERQENRRFAAVLVLRELAANSPTLVYQYVRQIIDVIWVVLRDPKVLIRESAADAISVLFEIIAERDATLRDQWFSKIYAEINKGFQLSTVETIHGSLLALKELLLKGGMFMQSGTRYLDACEKIFSYREHREPLVRKEVTIIIPILAAYYPTEFSQQYLHKFMMQLQGQLKREKDRNPAFVAVGKVASAVGSAIDPYLDAILVYIREGLSVKARIRSTNDAPIFECISMIAIAVGQTMAKYMDLLLDPIFACGLSDALTQALVDMAHYIPPARPTIQEKLLNLLSQVLCGRQFMPLGSPAHGGPPSNITRDLRDPNAVEQQDAEIALALQTLGSFDFSGYILNEFVRDVAIRYVEADNPIIRKAAALTCCQLFVKDPIVHQVSRHAIQVVGSVIEKVLAVAVADQDAEIRYIVLSSLDTRFDRHLAKAENIRTLFLAFNDEQFSNREAAMSILGRLASVNPAYVFPSLRKVLIQLLTEVEYSSNARNKQESAQLISHLVASSSRLIKPYVDPMVTVMLPKANDPDESVAATALRTIGDLAAVGGEDMIIYFPSLMAIIIKSLSDISHNIKRSAAVRTLGQLATSAGYVVDPYIDYPDLLNILVNIVKTDPPGTLRRDTIRLIGILGALDPYKHQLVQEQSPEHNQVAENHAVTDVSLIMNGLTPSSEDFYPTIVIYTLTTLIRDASLSQFHQSAIDAIMNIYNTMGMKCVGFLGQVIPAFIGVIREAPRARVEGYFSQMSSLVRTVRQHIRPFLNDILDIAQTTWHLNSQSHGIILSLIESISRSLEGEFKVYLARVLPLMLAVLEEDHSPKRGPTERVLHAFLIFGSSAEEYMHLIIPVIVRMFDKSMQPVSVCKSAIETIGKISRKVNISEFAVKIIHPLLRVFASNDMALRQTALDTLCALVFQLGLDYLHFIPTVNKVLAAHRISHGNYTLIVSKLQKGEPLPQDLSPDEYYRDVDDEQHNPEISSKNHPVNQEHLKSAWDAGQRSTKEDWNEWIRRLSIELLKESPQQALRACAPLASAHMPTARALFNSGFISCYTLLFPQYQEELVRAIEIALTSTAIPPEILQMLLNLAEFMEHDDKALPIDVRTLGIYAGRCHAWAKALHYKELEFTAEQSTSSVEALISINNQLQQQDAAVGILRKAGSYADVEMKETWFEKLNRWDEALASYQKKAAEEPYSFQITMGKMRCLHALGEWDILSSLAEDKWARAVTDGHQRQIAPLAAAASWGLGQWELMDKYLGAMKLDSPDRSFFGAILSIHRNQFDDAQLHIEKARDGLDTELSALLAESYTRAYGVIVRVQMLAELEEIITYKQNNNNPDRQETMRRTWTKRLLGCQRNVEVWQRMLKVRALVIRPADNQDMWIKFANLCRKSQRLGLAEKSLRALVGTKDDLSDIPLNGTAPHPVNYAILKYMWTSKPDARMDTMEQLKEFTHRLGDDIQVRVHELNTAVSHVNGMNGTNGIHALGMHPNADVVVQLQSTSEHPQKQVAIWHKLLARCYQKQGQWQVIMQRGDWHDEAITQDILASFSAATRYDSTWYKAWHSWALANFEIVDSMTTGGDSEAADIAPTAIHDHVIPAIQGFFKSIALSSSSSIQDVLRVLTLWYAHGSHPEVIAAVNDGAGTVSVDTWLEVIPQLIARINHKAPRVRQSLHHLLCEIGRAHPQALVFPLTVSFKSDVGRRSRLAYQIMESLRQHSAKLVEQADLVSHELIRIAVLWHEQWYEGLEEASRMYFGDHNIDGMLGVLNPLHEMLDKGPETLREISFIQSFGRELHEAHDWCKKYKRSGDIGDLNQAWDVYYQIFKKISRQMPQLVTLELQYVAPKLKKATDLELAIPGTYHSGRAVVKITSFDPVANVIPSKNRPRKLEFRGSDGLPHTFLLKGHEDIRQDERVMQLFGLVNTLLARDPESLKRHLTIQRYSAVPLSTQSGLLGWVPNSDTFHMLIKEYRDSRKILSNIECRIMQQMAPDYDNLTLMQKVEVFSYAMDNTTGQDLYRVLWLKSKSSESWLDRRTNYIRSLAVMSIVGYILGLGDRHPSNLMLDRVTGMVIHIDFGDCFDIARFREKYPEKVGFRLTRMLTYAMEVSNIEGSFRTTAEIVMRLIRDNKESLMAVLEAFVHDPLVHWKLDIRKSGPPGATTFPSERRGSLIPLPNPVAAVAAANPLHPTAAESLSGRPRKARTSISQIARPSLHANGIHGNGNGVNGVSNGNASVTAINNAVAAALVAEQDLAQDKGGPAPAVRGDNDPEFTSEVKNTRALQVMARIKEKLTGRDFKKDEELAPDEQVDKLINEATNLENLCQHYVGWCSFW